MCGIAGFIDKYRRLKEPRSVLCQMTNTLSCRGPDGEGVWCNEGECVGLGHRRLSIIDLSAEGRQPMISNNGRYVITYNGEVYNFVELRVELENQGYIFRGHSDTEVILAAIEVWGLEKAVSKFIGMFAFALWDQHNHKFSLVRDRVGIKPIYYGYVNGAFVFASELKALRVYPGFCPTINRNAIALFLRYKYIPAPYSIYQGIYKLLPGHILDLNSKDRASQGCQTHAYWTASSIIEQGVNEPFTGTSEEAIERLDELLRESVKLRMLSDVPLGAFLSGGIDSSLIVALMQAQCKQAVKTFSIGFYESEYNEAVHAKAVAKYLGTEHVEYYLSSEEAMAVIPMLPTLFDEPFSDPSQIPTFLVSKLARKHVTVSLSGDGGDELFYGYRRYDFIQRIWKKISWIPSSARIAVGKIMSSSLFAENRKLCFLSEILLADSQDDFYRNVMSNWKKPVDIVLHAREQPTPLTDAVLQTQLKDFSRRMMFYDLISYLPDDILVKVDRSSMGVSLEARVPLLDHRVVEFAMRLPLDLKLRYGQGKWILRQVLYKYLPRELVERPKMGFGVPINIWLRGPLQNWAEELLNEQRLRDEGYFNFMPIRERWEKHLAGTHEYHFHLWSVLMFQAWLEGQ